jgi:hypothetical protein
MYHDSFAVIVPINHDDVALDLHAITSMLDVFFNKKNFT